MPACCVFRLYQGPISECFLHAQALGEHGFPMSLCSDTLLCSWRRWQPGSHGNAGINAITQENVILSYGDSLLRQRLHVWWMPPMAPRHDPIMGLSAVMPGEKRWAPASPGFRPMSPSPPKEASDSKVPKGVVVGGGGCWSERVPHGIQHRVCVPSAGPFTLCYFIISILLTNKNKTHRKT